jgi:uncharacterized protein DUF4255
VLADADRSLAAFLGAALGKVTISFDAPTAEWAATAKRPSLSLFLYLAVEDPARRAADMLDVRDSDGRVTARQAPVRHYQLHYLASAWAADTEHEHRLLGEVLAACAGHHALPARCRAGVLADEPEPMVLAAGAAGPVAAHEVWSSLGMPLRAAVSLCLIAPLRPALDVDVAAPAEHFTMGIEAVDATSVAAGPPAATRAWTTIRVREREHGERGPERPIRQARSQNPG